MIIKYKTNYHLKSKASSVEDFKVMDGVKSVNEETKEVVVARWNYISGIEDCGVFFDVDSRSAIVEYYKDGNTHQQVIYGEAYLLDDSGKTIEVIHR